MCTDWTHQAIRWRKKYSGEVAEQVFEEPPKQEVRIVPTPAKAVERREHVVKERLTVPKPEVDIPKAEEKTRSQQHRYYQGLIKKMAEEWGYRATIEEPTADGAGRVDVALERNGEKIACEISFTTTEEHELENVKKCLASGYTRVIVCALEKKRLQKIRMAVLASFPEGDDTRILFFEPEDLFQFLHQEASRGIVKEGVIKGRRVTVQVSGVQVTEQKQKQEAITKVILDSMRRMKGKQ